MLGRERSAENARTHNTDGSYGYLTLGNDAKYGCDYFLFHFPYVRFHGQIRGADGVVCLMMWNEKMYFSC